MLKKDKYRKSRGGHSRFLIVSCRKCSTPVCLYQKDGPGDLYRLYRDRILQPEIKKKLVCPKCWRELGAAGIYDAEKRECINLFAGAVTKKIISIEAAKMVAVPEQIDAPRIEVTDEDVLLFLKQADKISQSDLMNMDIDYTFSLSIKGKGDGHAKFPSIELKILESFLMRIRPVIERGETAYLGRIMHYLYHKTENSDVKKDLEKFFQAFYRIKNDNAFSVRLGDGDDVEEWKPWRMVSHFMYSEYFHLDKDKIKRNKQSDLFAVMSAATALAKLNSMAKLTISLAQYIRDTELIKPAA